METIAILALSMSTGRSGISRSALMMPAASTKPSSRPVLRASARRDEIGVGKKLINEIRDRVVLTVDPQAREFLPLLDHQLPAVRVFHCAHEDTHWINP